MQERVRMKATVLQESNSRRRETINSESKVCGSDTNWSSQLCGRGRRMQVFLKHCSCHPSRGGGQVDMGLKGPRLWLESSALTDHGSRNSLLAIRVRVTGVDGGVMPGGKCASFVQPSDSHDWAGGQTEIKVPWMAFWRRVLLRSHSCPSGSPGYLCWGPSVAMVAYQNTCRAGHRVWPG